MSMSSVPMTRVSADQLIADARGFISLVSFELGDASPVTASTIRSGFAV